MKPKALLKAALIMACVYTPATGDTGGAILDAFAMQSGLLLIIR